MPHKQLRDPKDMEKTGAKCIPVASTPSKDLRAVWSLLVMLRTLLRTLFLSVPLVSSHSWPPVFSEQSILYILGREGVSDLNGEELDGCFKL